ncbi:MAG: hypothetical protein ACJ8AH_16670 [Stellaceae bacterium]|jgi:hypothetical protein
MQFGQEAITMREMYGQELFESVKQPCRFKTAMASGIEKCHDLALPLNAGLSYRDMLFS